MPVVSSKFITLLSDPRGGKERVREREEKKRKSRNNLWPIASNKVFLSVPLYHSPHPVTADYAQVEKRKKKVLVTF